MFHTYYVHHAERIDENNRPRDLYFYSGAPSYYKLKFQLYQLLSVTKEIVTTTEQPTTNKPLYVLKDRSVLEQILDENIEGKKVIFF